MVIEGNRQVRLVVRLSEKESGDVQEAVATTGLKMSQWAREVLRDAAVRRLLELRRLPRVLGGEQ